VDIMADLIRAKLATAVIERSIRGDKTTEVTAAADHHRRPAFLLERVAKHHARCDARMSAPRAHQSNSGVHAKRGERRLPG
jgi:hypothetical protein